MFLYTQNLNLNSLSFLSYGGCGSGGSCNCLAIGRSVIDSLLLQAKCWSVLGQDTEPPRCLPMHPSVCECNRTHCVAIWSKLCCECEWMWHVVLKCFEWPARLEKCYTSTVHLLFIFTLEMTGSEKMLQIPFLSTFQSDVCIIILLMIKSSIYSN